MAKIAAILIVFALLLSVPARLVLGEEENVAKNVYDDIKGKVNSPEMRDTLHKVSNYAGDIVEETKKTGSSWGDWVKNKLG
ncbi:conserved hypothetical protein [Ricinus communis]|uniref:Uncharacterized protein n=1 Tax=Ricinus communis TaxID=3988 RepID=B9R7V7_RICCO|nr:conserved hypothetical protein [Ricinus communis]